MAGCIWAERSDFLTKIDSNSELNEFLAIRKYDKLARIGLKSVSVAKADTTGY